MLHDLLLALLGYTGNLIIHVAPVSNDRPFNLKQYSKVLIDKSICLDTTNSLSP